MIADEYERCDALALNLGVVHGANPMTAPGSRPPKFTAQNPDLGQSVSRTVK
jgi:hypothetical protein